MKTTNYIPTIAILALLAAAPAQALVSPAAMLSEFHAAAGDGDPQAQLDCLALNVYHEARGEPAEGKFAVAMVTLNRVRSPEFPSTNCRVVWQRGQFSWTKDGRPDRPYNAEAWRDAVWIATLATWYAEISPAGEATYFHTVDVNPRWARTKQRLRAVGRHVFYASRKR